MTPPLNQDQPTGNQLKLGYWVATHRPLLRRLGIGCLSAIAGLSILVFLSTLINWMTHIAETNQITASLLEPSANFASIRKPEDPAVRRAVSVRRDATTVDAIVELVNPNDIWAATNIEYEILVGSTSTGRTTATLAPLQELILTTAATATGDAPPVQFIIHEITWVKMAKVDHLPDDEWEFVDASLSSIQSSAQNALYKTQFNVTVQNRSVFGFRDAEVVVLLVDDENDVKAIGSVQLVAIESLESRPLTFRWPERLSRNLTPIIQINIDKLTEDRIIRKLSD